MTGLHQYTAAKLAAMIRTGETSCQTSQRACDPSRLGFAEHLRGLPSSRLGYPRGMTTVEILVAKAKALPPEGQREVLDFVEFLETRLGRGTPHKSLSGALADLGVDLSAEDIDQARREAWADFPRRDL